MSLSFEVKSSEIHQRGEAPETALVKVGIVGVALVSHKGTRCPDGCELYF